MITREIIILDILKTILKTAVSGGLRQHTFSKRKRCPSIAKSFESEIIQQ